ncbi:MAG: BamA/TamA family outer membrane protein [Rhizobacter sp.]|nr:BamA/TamA family outer membrane protein [Ferruginibacter sp.]
MSAQQTNYELIIHTIGKDSGFTTGTFGLQTNFNSPTDAAAYLAKIPLLLASKGYPAASVDSSWDDSSRLHISLYAGPKYNWLQLGTAGIDKPALSAAGYIEKNFTDRPVNFSQLQLIQQRLLNYYERNGYPFAAVFLDSIQLDNDKMIATLKAEKGVLYHIDSISMPGKVKLNKNFLQRYLDIKNGSIYNKEKLEQVDKRMLELPFVTTVQASDISMLGTGSILNLYTEPKRSSQVNFLVGFLPASGDSKKLQVTGDVNLDLKNLLGGAEEILVKWQQLQPKSPRLNLGFTKPYIFNSPFGINFLFDLFKKDSNFLQINAQAGVQFNLSNDQNGKLFLQWQNNTLLSGAVDTNAIKIQKLLPPNIDLSTVNVGFNYELLKTNYRFNPRTGNELNLTSVVGIKTIKQNGDIIGIKDPGFNYTSLYDSIKPKTYQLRFKLNAAHYFPLKTRATLKAAVQGGYYSSPNVFRNELFQIGGYKLLRGFNEESIYASRYAVFTAEYRYLVDLNSYLFVFTDVGLVKNKYQAVNANNQFIGGGLGIMYETKAGLLNLSYAVGKRDDVKFNIRESSKLHFGYINYF